MVGINNKSIFKILHRALNNVDHRLMDHGKRVSFIVYKMLKTKGTFTPREVRDLCLLAMIHDIGAYKTDEINQMILFETQNVWEHSVYGSLFIKYFSPLSHWSPVILLHHGNCIRYPEIDRRLQKLAQMLHIADRADIFFREGLPGTKDFYDYLKSCGKEKFCQEAVDLFIATGLTSDCLDFDNPTEDINEYYQAINQPAFTDEEMFHYLAMVVFTIDFRSSATVTHTITTTTISHCVAEIMGIDGKAQQAINQAALLHDLGKIGIPTEILEFPGRLTDEQMDVMRTHVEITGQIIDGLVDPKIQEIAIAHHEKLDGSGYPLGLKAEELSTSQRIVAVADILSALTGVRSYKKEFSKTKSLEILKSMANHGLIDSDIVYLIHNKFDYIMDVVKIKSDPILEVYNKMNREFPLLVEFYKNFKTPDYNPEMLSFD